MNDQSSPRNRAGVAHVFALGRDAGKQARATDWSASDLGAVENWSPALRCTASLVMRNESPMLLCWGSTFVQIYNDACRILFGEKHPVAMGQRVKECWHEEHSLLVPLMERALFDHTTANAEQLLLHRNVNGHDVRLGLTFSPVPDEAVDGSGIGGVLITVKVEAVTYVAELRRSDDALFSFLMQVPAPICVLAGRDLVFEVANQPFCEMMARSNIVGQTLGDAFPELQDQGPTGHSFAEILRDVMADGSTFEHRELPVSLERHGKVDLAYFNAVFAPITSADGSMRRVVVVGTEITSEVTARVRAEEAQRAVEITSTELRTAAALRDDFLTVASHELRTPLTTLGLQIDGLLLALHQATLDAPPTAKLIDKANKLRTQADRLEALIEGMLDVFSLGSDNLSLQLSNFDLADAARSVVSRLALEFRSIHIEFQSQACVGLWDRARVEQVIAALLSNALKFGAGKPIEVGVNCSSVSGTVWVTDRGIGIDPADQQRIFGRFVRAAPSNQYSGFGLGLWIVQEIVKAMGGQVRVESQPGAGSTFSVELPRSV